MAHGDAVGYRDGTEFARRAAGFLDPPLGRLRLAHQRDIAWRRFVPAGRHANEGTMDLLFRQPHRIIIGAMRRPLRPFGDVAGRKLGFVKSRHEQFFNYLSSPLEGEGGPEGRKGGLSERRKWCRHGALTVSPLPSL